VLRQCNAPPSVTISSNDPALSGSLFTRATATAIVTPSLIGEDFKFLWRLRSVPTNSKINPANSQGLLTNAQGLVVSFVPDVVGPYTLELTVSGGCGANVVETVVVQTSCGSSMDVSRPQVSL
jgi:hypothetical protein